MKYLSYLLIVAIIFLSSCSHYTQVVTIKSSSEGITKSSYGFYEYENSDLKIRYSFWAEHGIMAFQIYNKTDHPVYIDWKKSSMISGEKQKQYYINKTTSNFSAYGSSYGTSWVNLFSTDNRRDYYGTSHVSGSETIVKPERISFISPKSYISQAFYNLTANIYFSVKESSTKETRINGVKMYESTSDFDIKFRNYLTYADNEDFTVEKNVDNGFQVSKVYTMKEKEFGTIDNSGVVRSEWEKPSRFYILQLTSEEVYGKN